MERKKETCPTATTGASILASTGTLHNHQEIFTHSPNLRINLPLKYFKYLIIMTLQKSVTITLSGRVIRSSRLPVVYRSLVAPDSRPHLVGLKLG